MSDLTKLRSDLANLKSSFTKLRSDLKIKVRPGQIKVRPRQMKVRPGQIKVKPGQIKVRSGQINVMLVRSRCKREVESVKVGWVSGQKKQKKQKSKNQCLRSRIDESRLGLRPGCQKIQVVFAWFCLVLVVF